MPISYFWLVMFATKQFYLEVGTGFVVCAIMFFVVGGGDLLPAA